MVLEDCSISFELKAGAQDLMNLQTRAQTSLQTRALLAFLLLYPIICTWRKINRTRFKDKNHTDTFDTEANTSLQWSNTGLLFFVINPSLAILAQTMHAVFSGEDGISLVLEGATKEVGVSSYWKGKTVTGLLHKLKQSNKKPAN